MAPAPIVAPLKMLDANLPFKRENYSRGSCQSGHTVSTCCETCCSKPDHGHFPGEHQLPHQHQHQHQHQQHQQNSHRHSLASSRSGRSGRSGRSQAGLSTSRSSRSVASSSFSFSTRADTNDRIRELESVMDRLQAENEELKYDLKLQKRKGAINLERKNRPPTQIGNTMTIGGGTTVPVPEDIEDRLCARPVSRVPGDAGGKPVHISNNIEHFMHKIQQRIEDVQMELQKNKRVVERAQRASKATANEGTTTERQRNYIDNMAKGYTEARDKLNLLTTMAGYKDEASDNGSGSGINITSRISQDSSRSRLTTRRSSSVGSVVDSLAGLPVAALQDRRKSGSLTPLSAQQKMRLSLPPRSASQASSHLAQPGRPGVKAQPITKAPLPQPPGRKKPIGKLAKLQMQKRQDWLDENKAPPQNEVVGESMAPHNKPIKSVICGRVEYIY